MIRHIFPIYKSNMIDQFFLAVPESHEAINPHNSRAKQASEDMVSTAESQPFLHRFSAGWVYARMLSIIVEYLEKQGRYKEANNLLQCLLSQELYCTSSRGRWWERIALNLDCHLRQKEKVCLQRSRYVIALFLQAIPYLHYSRLKC